MDLLLTLSTSVYKPTLGSSNTAIFSKDNV